MTTVTAGPPEQPPTPLDLSGDPGRRMREQIMRLIFLGAAVMSLVISVMILIALFTNGWEFLSQVEWSTVFTDNWNPRSDSFSITTLLAGSLVVTGVAMVVAVPLGLGAAIYLSEYSSRRVRAVLKPILEVLAGVPSVVLGFFALTWIAPNIVGPLFDQDRGSMMAAGIGVGILSIPLVASVSEDAMRAVPESLREASSGLGARKRTTTVRVVLPAAISGIVAALILAISRAIGETMVVFIAGGAADTATFSADPREGSLTMTAAMASLATGTDRVRGADLAIPSLYFVGIVLFFTTMGLNLIADGFVRRVREVY
jgi:phosphate transport system permease protein